MYIGVDDTDSVMGMCTTYLATELIREFGELDLIGNPRLVRLNPNVPWKTRGNGAVCLRLGRGRGRPRTIGQIAGDELKCYDDGVDVMPKAEHMERACRVVEELARFDDDRTNPGLILTGKKPPQKLYWLAVREVVDRDEHLAAARPEYRRGWKEGRGLIGAISAAAWRPRDRTYELIAYRSPDRWGSPREIGEASVMEMDSNTASTFNNYDYEEGHVAIAPNSPCPVLYGIRGDDEDELPGAMRMIRSEEPERWLIWLTNQGTDEHIVGGSIPRLRPFTSVRVRGRVASMPEMIEGGHMVFSIAGRRGKVDCTIYEPAKGFRFVGEKLRPGDLVTVMGGVREQPRTINVEKLLVEEVARYEMKTANPMCRACGKRMKSAGRGQGYRCMVCGARAGEADAEFAPERRELTPGWYEPPVGSRRHLAMPLKRMPTP